MTRILLIEKSAQFGIERHLDRAGMTCDALDCSDEIELAELDYDVIVFDLALGGFEIVRRLRRAGHRMPIIVLTGIDDYKVRVTALDAGADDVLVMPFFGLELVARIRAVTRRTLGLTQNVVSVGRMTVFLDRQEVEVDSQQTVRLSTKQFRLLAVLCQNKGRLISKTQIISHLYRDDEEPANEKIIDVMLSQIRKKLGSAAEYIRTVHGTGHCVDDTGPRIRSARRLARAA
jgi:DNA-binding response OmpR family regulator